MSDKYNVIAKFIIFFTEFKFYTYENFIIDYNNKNEIKTNAKEIESIKRNLQKQEIMFCKRFFFGKSKIITQKMFDQEKCIKYLIKLQNKK